MGGGAGVAERGARRPVNIAEALLSAVLERKPVLTEVSHATERRYSVAEIGKIWNLSQDRIRRLSSPGSGPSGVSPGLLRPVGGFPYQ
jgi:hypothetical protein